MRTTNVQSSARVLSGSVVVSEKFISNCVTLFDEAMQHKAQKVRMCMHNEIFSSERSSSTVLCF